MAKEYHCDPFCQAIETDKFPARGLYRHSAAKSDDDKPGLILRAGALRHPKRLTAVHNAV
jgi:hypothetical protein